MYPGYWDDYMNDGTENTLHKDKVNTIWRVYHENGALLKEGQHARKQVLHGLHGYTKGQMKKFNNSEKLKELGYTLFTRKWNVSHKKWESESFAPIN